MRTFMLIVSMTTFIFTGCHQQKKSESLVIEMTNPTDRYRDNAGIVIERSKLNYPDSKLLPVLYDNNGKLIVSQLDDIDQDGQWDELAFICNFAPNENRTATLTWVTSEKYPTFKDSIQTSAGKESFKQFTASGDSILQEADSIGLGEIAVYSNKATYPIGKPNYLLISEGPVRRIYGIDRKESKVSAGRIAEMVTIWAGHKGYEKEIALINMPPNTLLLTGIKDNVLNQDTTFRAYEYGYVALMAHTLEKKSYYTGMAIIIPDEYYTRRGYTAYKGLNLWYAELKPNAENKVTFYVYGAKEKDNEGFRSADYFEEFIDYETLYIDNPIEINLVN